MRIAMAFEFVAERNRPEVHDIEGVYTESELERAQPMGFQPNPVTEDEDDENDSCLCAL